MQPTKRLVRIASIRYEAEGILSFVLAAADGAPLPEAPPGSHVDIRLPNGMLRSYSLSNGAADAGAYRVTVALEMAGRGGSAYMHGALRAGQLVEIGAPRNNFPLHEEAPVSVLIAGGIGITPFIPMAMRLNALGRPWRLHYAARCRNRAAFLREVRLLAAVGAGEVSVHLSDDPSGAALDIPAIIRDLPPGSHAYCCGPARMLEAFRLAVAERGVEPERIHLEYFAAPATKAAAGGFTIVLQRSGLELAVRPDQSILEAVTEHGIDVPSSCEEGICGSCATRVLGGEPDSRDMVLSEREKAEGKTIMICCSGSKSPVLVLDL